MLRFILLLIGGAASVIMTAVMIRFLFRNAFKWDTRICNKRGSSFCGFRRHFRMPFAVGVIPEYFYFLILGRDNYFNARWWALRMGSYISFLLFLAILFNRSSVQEYYSWSHLTENGLMAYINAGSGIWYLNMVNLLFLALFTVIVIESIRMHKGWAPVRIVLYGIMSIMMAYVSVMVLALIIALTILYVCYKIIRFFMSSNRRNKVKVDVDDNDEPHEKLNNAFRRFRAELYAWEDEREVIRDTARKEKKTEVKIKRTIIRRKPRKKKIDRDIPRIHPE